MRTMSLPIRLYTFQANLGARRFYSRHGFVAIEFGDGRANEERCPDVLYELTAPLCEALTMRLCGCAVNKLRVVSRCRAAQPWR